MLMLLEDEKVKAVVLFVGVVDAVVVFKLNGYGLMRLSHLCTSCSVSSCREKGCESTFFGQLFAVIPNHVTTNLALAVGNPFGKYRICLLFKESRATN